MEMRVSEVAEKLNVSRYHVVHLLHWDKLSGKRWGREWQIDSESVMHYIATRRKYTKRSSQLHAQNQETSRIIRENETNGRTSGVVSQL